MDFKPTEQKSLKQRDEERITKLEDAVILADTIKKFIGTDLGEYLVKKIEADLADIRKKLVTVRFSWWNTSRITKLQAEHHALNRLQIYLANALNDGKVALSQLDAKQYINKSKL